MIFYWGIALTGGGLVGYFVNKILLIYFIRKNRPELIDEDIELGPLPNRSYRWEQTAGTGIVPRWASAIGLLAVGGFVAGIVVLIVGFLRWAFA